MDDVDLIDLQLTRDNISYIIRNLSRAAHLKYNGYAYSAGYFESLAADLIATLPESAQEYWIDVIQRTTIDLEKE